jgi:prepilin-type N-terminal cleavage/methylation domain-containing protein
MYRSPKSQFSIKRSLARQSTAGFTIVELLVVIIIAGVLAAIAAPGWLSFMDSKRVNSAQGEALQAMRRAQSQAIKKKQIWEVGFREQDERLQWSAHRVESSTKAAWVDLPQGEADRIKIDTANSNLDKSPCKASDAEYCVQFQSRGELDETWRVPYLTGATDGMLGKITFTTVTGGDDAPKRCVFVSTILGSTRVDRDDGCTK